MDDRVEVRGAFDSHGRPIRLKVQHQSAASHLSKPSLYKSAQNRTYAAFFAVTIVVLIVLYAATLFFHGADEIFAAAHDATHAMASRTELLAGQVAASAQPISGDINTFSSFLVDKVNGFIAGLFGKETATPDYSRPSSGTTTILPRTIGPPLVLPATSTPLSHAAAITPPQPSSQTIINYPVIERIIEREVPPAITGVPAQAGITQAVLDVQLQQLDNKFSSKLAALSASSNYSYAPATAFAQSQRIDNLGNLTISNATVHGVSGLTAADIPTNITASNYLPLSGGTLAGDLTLTGNLTVSGAQTLSGAITIPYLTATSTTVASSFQQLLVNASTTLQNVTFANATGISATTTNFFSTNASTTNATSTNLFATLGHFTTAIIDAITNLTTTNLIATNATMTNATTTNLAISSAGTNMLLSTNGQRGVVSTSTPTAASYIATSTTASQLPYASSTAITVSGTASTSNLTVSNNFTFGSVTGFLKAVAGVVSTALVNLTSDVTGILPVANGGTGWGNVASGAILYGNGAGALATTTTSGVAGQVLAFLNGVPTWTATTTFSAPLTFSAGNVSIPAANSSTNGYLASGDWTSFNSKISSSSLSGVSPITYNSGTGAIGFDFSTNNSWTGLNQFTRASSTQLSVYGPAYFGASATSSFSVTGALTLATALTVPNGGTGSTTLTALLKGNGTGSILSAVAGTDYQSPITVSYPILFSSNNLSLAFGTTTTNTWSNLQTFQSGFVSQASSTITGGLATLAGGASTTNLTASGTVFSGTASTTNLIVSSVQNSILSANATGAVGSLGVGNGLTFSGNIISTSFSTTSANTWTALQQFAGGASTTNFSVFNTLYIGGSATSTLQSNATGTSTLQGVLNVTGINSTSTFSGNVSLGNFNVTGTATSTAANGINLSAGCFSVLGTCVGSGGASLTGTTGQVAYFSGTNTAVGTSSLFIVTSGNVGIGTTSPAATLDVYKSSSGATADQAYFTNPNSASSTASRINFRALDTLGNGTTTSAITSILQQNYSAGKADLALSTLNSGTLAEVLRITSAGNVGIGTTSPSTTFGLVGSEYLTGGLGIGTLNTSAGTLKTSGNTTVGGTLTISGGALTVSNGGTGVTSSTGSGNVVLSASPTFTGSINFPGSGIWNSSGKVGVGMTSPFANSQFVVRSGTDQDLFIGPESGGSFFVSVNDANSAYELLDLFGTVVTINNMSDQRLKTNIADLNDSKGLSAIDQLHPVTFNWKDSKLNQMQGQRIGLIAQEVQNVFPNLVTPAPTASSTITLPDGSTEVIDHPLTLNYEGLIVPLVKAVQELYQKLTDLANTVAGFAEKIVTHLLAADEVDTNKLCVGSICVNEQQLKTLLANAGTATSPTSDNAPAKAGSAVTSSPAKADTEPPVITINGENPAHIHVGDTYADLGASVTDNLDKNLGIKTYLNGALVSNVVIDTSAVATDTIDYVAADQAGNTATSTRTVFIDPTDTPSIVPSNGATSTATTTTI
jgi:Chaperone of endosialidase/Domain of unknown function (DUF5011)